MDAAMIDLKDLAKYLRKRRIIILVAALAFALMFNIYGVRKAGRNIERAEERHLAYTEAVGELPGYYTEQLFNLRSRLSNNAAEFVEAYANIYKNFLKEYQTENAEIETENLEAYMMFLDSYKDVLSVMSGTQREYYELLISTDTNTAPDTHPIAEPFERAPVSAVQPVWLIIGIFVGAAAACVIIVLCYTFRKPGQTS